jgi:hypothetical protein
LALDGRWQPKRFFRAADPLLATGFLATAFAAGLLQFVMLGLLGLGLFVVALGFFLIAGVVARGDMRLSWGRQIAGFAMFVIGILALMFSAERGTTLAFDDVMTVRTGLAGPSSLQWIFLALVSVLAAATIASAILLKAGWSRSRCFFGGAAALAVSPSAIVIFWILKFTGQPLNS